MEKEKSYACNKKNELETKKYLIFSRQLWEKKSQKN